MHLAAGAALPPVRPQEPFRAVVIVEQDVQDEWRNAVSAWLVDSGCLYMIAWGRECSAWDDAVDWANLEAHNFGDIPEDALVMTSWHDNERLAEALWFAGQVAQHSEVELTDTLIVHVSPSPEPERLLIA